MKILVTIEKSAKHVPEDLHENTISFHYFRRIRMQFDGIIDKCYISAFPGMRKPNMVRGYKINEHQNKKLNN